MEMTSSWTSYLP